MATRTDQAMPHYAFITGASQGLGRAIAEECASRGMNLFLVALPGSGLPRVAEQLTTEWQVRVEWLEIDLTREDAPDVLMETMAVKGFEPDLLVNNAGIGSIGTFAASPLCGHEAVMRLNVLALTRLTHRLIPDLRRKPYACILNVASLGAFFPMVSLPVYSATKSYVLTFSLALREELQGTVRVGALCPNAIRNDRATEEYVDRLPFFCGWACLYPSQIARAGIDGVLRGRAIIVPGIINKVLRVVGPLVPRFLATGVIRHLWGGFGGEAKDVVAARP